MRPLTPDIDVGWSLGMPGTMSDVGGFLEMGSVSESHGEKTGNHGETAGNRQETHQKVFLSGLAYAW